VKDPDCWDLCLNCLENMLVPIAGGNAGDLTGIR